MQPSVSVIVPVYNIEQYIGKCLDSIIGQTLKEIEIIVVDDGSTDDSSRIIDRYARTDSRIVAIHKTNGGVVSARNCGIAQATGLYILFVDGDDHLAPDTCDLLLKKRKRPVPIWSSCGSTSSILSIKKNPGSGHKTNTTRLQPFTRWRTRSSDGVFGLAS